MYIKIAVNAYSAQLISDTDVTGQERPGLFGSLKKIMRVVLIGSELGGMMRVAPLWWKREAEPC